MFWGLIMEPNKRYTQEVEKPFHISQAAMDISTGDNNPCQVMVVVDGKNFLVCTLQKNKTIQVPLDLYFKIGDSISFLTNGKCNVHLTGYLDPEFEEELSDDDAEDEEEEEAPALVPAKIKRKLENSNDEAVNKKAKKNVKQSNPVDSSDDESDEENQLQKLLDGDDIDTDENDDSFKVNTSADGTDSDEDEEDDDEEEEAEDEEVEQEGKDSSDEADTTVDTSKEDVDMSKLSKAQRRRLKRRLAKEAKETTPQVNGIDKGKKETPQEKTNVSKKEKPDKKESKEAVADKKEKKSLSGGVFIEDLKVGSGPAAKPGKTVMVFYEGRLKQNNKMFDSCQKGPGFKFRLGAKEVISAWDVGIAGMKVGGRRKILCPPAMAYGAKGSPPVIPPNSTLVFEVELKNVK